MRPHLVLLLAVACTPPAGKGDRPPTETATPAPTTAGTPTTGSPTTEPAPDPVVELGSGRLTHVPVAPGGDLNLTYGGQGGFHIEVSGKTGDLGEIVGVQAWVTVVQTGAEVARLDGSVALLLADYDAATGTGWFAGQEARLEDNALNSVCPLHGAELELCAIVSDLAQPDRVAEACVVGVGRMDDYERTWCGTGP